MENLYSPYYSGRTRNNLTKSSSLPLFNTHPRRYKPIVSPDVLKIQMMEERLKQLEKQKVEQNEQINSLMSYQMNQNRLGNNFVPNGLLLSANNLLPPIGYHLNKTQPIEKKYYIMKTDKELYKKERKLKEYKKNMEELKDLLERERNKRKMNKNIRNNIYLPIRKDINYLMDEMNNNFQKKMQNDNNIINANINEVQNNYDEMKYLLNNKMEKLELKQKMDFENLKNEIINAANQNQKEKDFLNDLIEDRLDYRNQYSFKEQLRNQRELDEIKHQKELDEIRHKHEIEDIENKKIMEELKFKNIKNSISKMSRMPQIPQIYPPPMVQQYPMPFMYPMPMPSYNSGPPNHTPSDDLIKLFMMKQLFGEEMFPQKKRQKIRKYKYYYAPPNYPPQPNYQDGRKYYRYSKSISDLSNSLTKKKSKKSSSKATSSKKSKKSKSTKTSKTTKKKKKDKKKKKTEDEEEEDEDEENEDDEDNEENEDDEGNEENEENEDDEGQGDGEGEGEDEGDGEGGDEGDGEGDEDDGEE